MTLATKMTANPDKKDAWTKNPIKTILNIRTYIVFSTVLKFLGKLANRKQSTCKRFANYPILNFLLHNTEYFKHFLTIANAKVFPKSLPNWVNL
jgi:hypothetical protein